MSVNAVTILFVRHGQTDWNAESRLQGNRDIPLNDNGRDQAKRNGQVLSEIISNPQNWTFVSSPLSRAIETMEIILQQIQGADSDKSESWEYETHQDLREIEFGKWEGLIWSEVQLLDPDLARQWKADRWSTPIPGGESYEILSARVGRWLGSVERNTVVVSHGGVSRCLRGHVSEIPNKEIPRLEVPQDKVLKIEGNRFAWY